MKQSHEVPVTAFQAGEGLLPAYQKLVREVVIPYQYQVLEDKQEGVEKSHALENLRLAAKKNRGEELTEDFYGMVFQDSDVAKWLEAAAYTLGQQPDAQLEQLVDQVIALLGEAQQEDGYLNSYFTVKAPDKKWTDLQEAHELYCAGHLMEAACAHYEATGKDSLLSIMRKNADCIYEQFTKRNPRGCPGHPEVELALMRLYRATGDEKYKELCGHFLDARGQEPNYFQEEKETRGWTLWGSINEAVDTDYMQASLPVRQQKDAVGHAVRAVYLYTAMANLAGESGDQSLVDACHALWESVTHRQMYVTGGIGSTVLGEAFTVDYDLPNATVYAGDLRLHRPDFLCPADAPAGGQGRVRRRDRAGPVQHRAGRHAAGRQALLLREPLGGGSGHLRQGRHPDPRPAPAAPLVRLRLLPAQRGTAAVLHWQLRLWGGPGRVLHPPVPGRHSPERPGLLPGVPHRLPRARARPGSPSTGRRKPPWPSTSPPGARRPASPSTGRSRSWPPCCGMATPTSPALSRRGM